jgi:hypothetical protein
MTQRLMDYVGPTILRAMVQALHEFAHSQLAHGLTPGMSEGCPCSLLCNHFC